MARRCGELLLVGLQLACKHVPHLVAQGGTVHVAMLALEEKVGHVLPAAVRWNEQHKVHHCCIALIEHHEQMIKDLALALPPSAPARLKSEDKKVLEGLGVTFCASLSDDVRHKRADAAKARRGSPRPSAVSSSSCVFVKRLIGGVGRAMITVENTFR